MVTPDPYLAPIPFSVEVFPARSSAAALALGHTVQRFAQRGPSFIAVTLGANGSSATESADLVQYISASAPVPVLAHVTTWGHSQDELRDRIRLLRDQGITRILAVRGDPPKVAVGEDAGDVTAADLVEIARDAFAECETTDLVERAVAAFPLGHPSGGGVERDLDLLLAKQEAGATRALTQVVFDAPTYLEYAERARAHGITIPIVPGIMPIVDPARLRRVAQLTDCPVPAELADALDRAADPAQAFEAGVAHAVALSRALLAAGAPALHFYTLNLAEPVLRVLDELTISSATSDGTAVFTTTEREFV